MTIQSAITAPTLIVVGMAVSFVTSSSAHADIAYNYPDRFSDTKTYITSGSPICPDQSGAILVEVTRNPYPMQPTIFACPDMRGKYFDNRI